MKKKAAVSSKKKLPASNAKKRVTRSASKKSVKCKPKKHYWSYRGGECPCLICGWYLQPGGKITKRP